MTEMTNEQLSALWNLARLDGRKALETIAEEEARTGPLARITRGNPN